MPGPVIPGIAPMLATLSRSLPDDPGAFAYEWKWDGFRMIGVIEPSGVTLRSRRGQDYTAMAPALQAITTQTGRHRLVVDGELCAVTSDGRTDFQALHTGVDSVTGGATRLAYLIFDLLWMDGTDLAERPYTERRRRLERLGLDGDAWSVPAAMRGDPAALLDESRRRGYEGLVAKRLDSPYRPGLRSRDWLKLKNHRRQEFVICGWTPGAGSRADRIGSLVLGVRRRRGGPLEYAGRVGTGFTDRTLTELMEALTPLHRVEPPLHGDGRPPRATRFVEPSLVAEVEFWEWTRDGQVRHPSFKGLREDKDPADVVVERPS
jgi:bifunctional non-homologous end joining protein LigD